VNKYAATNAGDEYAAVIAGDKSAAVLILETFTATQTKGKWCSNG